MKKIVLLLALCVTCLVNAQTVQSTCVRTDSMYQFWDKEAARLAMRRVYKYALPYKDSIKPEPLLRKRYRDALLAVFNATVIGETDTIFNQLKIHTKPIPEINSIRVEANPSLVWMMQLFNSQAPVGSPVINNLMIKYNMRYVYAQSAPLDVVVFITDTCLNMPLLLPQFLGQNAVTATNIATYDDTRDIKDSLNPGFVMLSYSYGWGTCGDGCDYRRTSTFKVYPDCSVEFVGTTGASLYVGLSENHAVNLQAYPFVNPTFNQIVFTNQVPVGTLTIKSIDGRIVQTVITNANQKTYALSSMAAGSYFIEMQTAQMRVQKRLVITE